ncbi:hypothetical protein HYX05_02915 [Candidatus Woesearchaeota archaeon]|nr:hypothetical protein [Candidatus Woesearchaeota archaeon]
MIALKIPLIFFMVFLALSNLAAAPPPPPPESPPAPGGGVDSGSSTINNSQSNASAASATCSDSLKNQNETDVDCGGSCTKCANQKLCLGNADCQSSYCNPNGRCSSPSCTDGWKNQNEIGIDCGGSCTPCTNQSQQAATQTQQNNQSSQQVATQPQADNPQPEMQNALSDSGVQALSNGDSSGQETSSSAAAEANQPQSDVQSSAYYGKSSILLISSLALNFVLVSFLSGLAVFLYINRGKAKEKSFNISVQNRPLVNSNIVNLKNYISSCLRSGYSQDYIKQVLLKNNWKEQDIDQAFREIGKWY